MLARHGVMGVGDRFLGSSNGKMTLKAWIASYKKKWDSKENEKDALNAFLKPQKIMLHFG